MTPFATSPMLKQKGPASHQPADVRGILISVASIEFYFEKMLTQEGI